MLNLPQSSRLRAPAFCVDEFRNDIFSKFVEIFKEESNKAFTQIKFGPTSIFDPRKLPEYLPTLGAYGCVELDKLLEHYGSRKSS